MISTQNNPRKVENFVVMATGETLLADGATTLTSATAPNPVQLNDGRLGLFSVSDQGTVPYYTATDATPTIAEAPVISFFQGTNGSADPTGNPNAFPLWNRVYEKTGDIDGRNSVVARYQAYRAPSFSSWFLGGPNGQITALNNTEYSLRATIRGRYMDEIYSQQGAKQLTISRVTPNFTTLATAEPVDWIYQYLGWDLNRNSEAITIDRTHLRGNYPIVAFAIDTTGLSGGTVINTLVPGFVPIVNTSSGVRGIVMTQEQIDALNTSVTNAGYAPGTATLLTIDLATAGTAGGGIADALIVMALDRRLAYKDRIPQVKNSIDIGLTSGFDFVTVDSAEQSVADEGDGISRTLEIQYRATHGQRKYSLSHDLDPIIEFPSPFVAGQNYDTFVIEHETPQLIGNGTLVGTPRKEIICVPTADAGVVTAITTALNSWLASANQPAVQ